ncbi:hypothetical protein GCM10023115_38650 [Pontixanthobacter gangjinensis]|uniref:Class I SAM-dependent methyltransferase n=1 Tax=Christiangramia aestuarii TaxID=1028746 RepID=A0A7M3SWL7_9FLAO|nr:class I SAM-dependent methyltransferase [Christiangramia aestuarii]MUP40998.1 class I SAM-dependent methyltransferase [Christiangramia aestuarii]
MEFQQTLDLFGDVDIYVIDQILKGRYKKDDKILDAGCGSGRNLKWFYKNGFKISGIDLDEKRLGIARNLYPDAASNFIKGELGNLPYPENEFDHILCCAVLHFAENKDHFLQMFSELIRVLKPGGSLLIRVASDIGLDGEKPNVQDPVNDRKAGFYITRDLISELMEIHQLDLLEPVKTTNVQDIRAMTTLVFRK